MHRCRRDKLKCSKTYLKNHLFFSVNFLIKDLIISRHDWNTKKTLNMYVNDAIHFSLTPEQPLFYSKNCFGTADGIAFDERTGFLRIHDLKTGTTPAHMEQLQIYAALFCLEYHMKPELMGMELRIYHNDEIMMSIPDGEDISRIMKTIIRFDDKIEKFKLEE